MIRRLKTTAAVNDLVGAMKAAEFPAVDCYCLASQAVSKMTLEDLGNGQWYGMVLLNYCGPISGKQPPYPHVDQYIADALIRVTSHELTRREQSAAAQGRHQSRQQNGEHPDGQPERGEVDPGNHSPERGCQETDKRK